MSQMVINGGKKLKGRVKISGAKNSVLPLLAATVLCDGEVTLRNCPDISDVDTALLILNLLGIETKFTDNTAFINAKTPLNTTLSETVMRKMRSSIVFTGSILARRSKAIVAYPGGCELGPRPIDIHIEALKKLGAIVTEDNGKLIFTAPNGLFGTEIDLKISSVGATENIILAATLSKGTTVINTAAREPEIDDLINFLTIAGAKINGKGTSTITVTGVEKLSAIDYFIMPDRIEAATYISAVATAGGEITLENVTPKHIESIIEVYKNAGCEITAKGSTLTVKQNNGLVALPYVKSMPYPAFPTDAGPLLVASLINAKGTSVYVEGVFENRFRFVSELKRMGADIMIEGRAAVINGKTLSPANCRCYDLRGGAAVVVAALGIKGKSVISDIEYINRGYEKITEKLNALGADVYIKE